MPTASPRHLRLVLGPQLELRQVCLASFHAAKMRVQSHAIPLNPVSAAGLCVQMAGGPKEALARLEGSDDWTVQVRNHLRQMIEEEARR